MHNRISRLLAIVALLSRWIALPLVTGIWLIASTPVFLTFTLFSALSFSPLTEAEILSRNSPLLRLRLGDNGGSANTVEYNPGIPPLFTPLGGGASEAEHTSTNTISGSSGTFTVRIITDVNARTGVAPPLTGTFTYDSTSGMACTTPATCGTEAISFTHIVWDTRDSDTLNSVTQYDGTSNQVFQTQTDNNGATNGTDNRHRNWFRFRYINDTLYPAGTYEGTVIANGSAF